MCEELVWIGGELVYVSAQHPNGLTEAQYRKLISRKPDLRNLQWVSHRRNPGVFVRGKVRHADHKTIVLLEDARRPSKPAGEVQFLGGVLFESFSECAGFARDFAKVEDQVRFLARTLNH